MSRQVQPSFVSNQVKQARRFYLDLNPEPSEALVVVCGGWEKCAPDYCVSRTTFPYYCVEFVAGGSGSLEIAGRSGPLQEMELRRGHVFSYGPECRHDIHSDRRHLLSKYFVDFSGHRALDLLEQSGLTPGNAVETLDPANVEQAFKHLIESGVGSGPNQRRVTSLQLEILLLEIAGGRVADSGHGQAYQTYQRCRAFIDEHFLKLANATELADACHLDPAYLGRLFNRYCDESPYRYLIWRKMTHAAGLLDGDRAIVSEVAADLGMDPFHFSRVFKRTFGLSPSQFIARRSLR